MSADNDPAPAGASGLGSDDPTPPRTVRLHGEPRELRRVLGAVDEVMGELDEYTQRKVRILVGELIAQSRYSEHPQELELGVEIHEDHVRIEISGDGFAVGDSGKEGDGALGEWSNWLVESVTDESSRSGDSLSFLIERRPS
jgi:hypothetical protein